VPAGYVRVDGKVTIDPERAPIVQLAFREYATGNYSLKSLAKALNGRGLRLPRAARFRNNRPAAEMWTADVLKDLLSNPRYVGRIPRKDGSVSQGTYPAIIDPEMWADCAQVRLKGRRV
jgi:hypothetical protein